MQRAGAFFYDIGSRFCRMFPALFGSHRLRRVMHIVLGVVFKPGKLSLCRIRAGELADAKLYLDLSNEKSIGLGLYEPRVQALLARLVRPGMVVYDVGANIGLYAVLFGRLVGETGKVICFEPVASNRTRLQQNLNANKLQAVLVDSRAVSEHSGQAVFWLGTDSANGRLADFSIWQTEGAQAGIEVPTTSLDDVVLGEGCPRPDICKLDIEGAEVAALRGMRRILRQIGPGLVIECHSTAILDEVQNELAEIGYDVRALPDQRTERKELKSSRTAYLYLQSNTY